MKILKIIVDKKPEYCANCPIYHDCNKKIWTTENINDGVVKN